MFRERNVVLSVKSRVFANTIPHEIIKNAKCKAAQKVYLKYLCLFKKETYQLQNLLVCYDDKNFQLLIRLRTLQGAILSLFSPSG